MLMESKELFRFFHLFQYLLFMNLMETHLLGGQTPVLMAHHQGSWPAELRASWTLVHRQPAVRQTYSGPDLPSGLCQP